MGLTGRLVGDRALTPSPHCQHHPACRVAGTPSTPAGPQDLDATDLYPEYSLHPSEVLSTVQWFSDGFISKHENYIFKHRISTCVSIEPSSAFPDASPIPHPLCLLLADRTVRPPPTSRVPPSSRDSSGPLELPGQPWLPRTPWGREGTWPTAS